MSKDSRTMGNKRKNNGDDDAYLIDYSALMTLPKSIILEAIEYAKRKREKEDDKGKEDDQYIRLKCIPPWAKTYGGKLIETSVTTGTQYEYDKEVSFQKKSQLLYDRGRRSSKDQKRDSVGEIKFMKYSADEEHEEEEIKSEEVGEKRVSLLTKETEALVKPAAKQITPEKKDMVEEETEITEELKTKSESEQILQPETKTEMADELKSKETTETEEEEERKIKMEEGRKITEEKPEIEVDTQKEKIEIEAEVQEERTESQQLVQENLIADAKGEKLKSESVDLLEYSESEAEVKEEKPETEGKVDEKSEIETDKVEELDESRTIEKEYPETELKGEESEAETEISKIETEVKEEEESEAETGKPIIDTVVEGEESEAETGKPIIDTVVEGEESEAEKEKSQVEIKIEGEESEVESEQLKTESDIKIEESEAEREKLEIEFEGKLDTEVEEAETKIEVELSEITLTETEKLGEAAVKFPSVTSKEGDESTLKITKETSQEYTEKTDDPGQTVSEKPSRDTEYIKRELGRILTKALAEIAWKRPYDPVHYLAHRLYHEYKQQQILEQQTCAYKIMKKEKERQMVSGSIPIKTFGYIERAPPEPIIPPKTSMEIDGEQEEEGEEVEEENEKLIRDVNYDSSLNDGQNDLDTDNEVRITAETID